ncbi:hypothetical protein SI65_09277 [Aspergillus cristatus]|uniref:Uncharacterized protein n=1 Tax=Aspergillus cristatus TaxID=573508 RepID=A0A1E3B4H2_ASPCR|nr:hypothetical protein SI65_09277 [Aspergillus cristatus]
MDLSIMGPSLMDPSNPVMDSSLSETLPNTPSKVPETSASETLKVFLSKTANVSESPSTIPMFKLDPSDVPEGWTTDPEEMDYGDEWTAEDSMGQGLARGMDLGDRAYPIMYDPKRYFIMFMAGGNFYILNLQDIRFPS